MKSNLCCLLVRLATLLGVFLVQSSEEATYEEFLNKHIDPEGPGSVRLNAYCNRVMVQRGMTTPKCTPWNTFINANPAVLQKVCSRGGRAWRDNLRESIKRFRLVACTHTGAPSDSRCQYIGRREFTRIRLGCVNNLPVRFERRQ